MILKKIYKRFVEVFLNIPELYIIVLKLKNIFLAKFLRLFFKFSESFKKFL